LQYKQRVHRNEALIHWGRFLMAIFALLIAATHLSYIIPSASALASQPSHVQANQTTIQAGTGAVPKQMPGGNLGFEMLGLWLDIEVIAYTLIAIVYLMGLRTWYVPATIFNAFNIGIYLLSGIIAIPGITSNAFGGHLALFTPSLTTTILIWSWIAAVIVSLLLLRYDEGSELDALLVTHRRK